MLSSEVWRRLQDCSHQLLASARLPNGQVRVFKRAELEQWELAMRDFLRAAEDCHASLAAREALFSSVAAVAGMTSKNPFPDGAAARELARAREELHAREEALLAMEDQLRRREQFLEQSESLLMRKLQQQQEQENRLELRREQLEQTERERGFLPRAPAVMERA